MREKGKFVVVEGIEGSGKSTLIKRLETRLSHANIQYVLTREPGGTKLGLKIRELLLSEYAEEMDTRTELLLFFADRAQHIKEVLSPNIIAENLILCDRFYYSTLAYQHYGRGIDRNLIDNLIKLVAAEYTPDLVLLVDLDPEIALKRAKSRANLDRIEKEDISFHLKVRTGFLELANENAENFIVLDGTKSETELEEEAFNAIQKRILNL